MSGPRHLSIARILRTRGNRGEVAAEILTDFPERFETLKSREVSLWKENARPFQLILESYWFHKSRIILKFQGISSISDAEALRDYELLVPREEAFSLPRGAYYQFDLLGCAVKDPRGLCYGEVKGVVAQGSGYLLEVESSQREILIPFAEEWLVRIDVEAKEIVLNLPEGLVNL